MNQPETPARGHGSSNKSGGVLPWVLVCATVACLGYVAFSMRPAAPARRLWLPVVVETNDSTSILGDTRQLEFWTPSVKTKDYLSTNGGGYSDREKWQVLASDDKVNDFGTMLHSNISVFGYRRVEEWGQGRTTFKPGWWWTMNVGTNFTVVDFAKAYRQFWNSPQALFVEVIDNRGSTEK
jgi:hypothetical protein